MANWIIEFVIDENENKFIIIKNTHEFKIHVNCTKSILRQIRHRLINDIDFDVFINNPDVILSLNNGKIKILFTELIKNNLNIIFELTLDINTYKDVIRKGISAWAK